MVYDYSRCTNDKPWDHIEPKRKDLQEELSYTYQAFRANALVWRVKRSDGKWAQVEAPYRTADEAIRLAIEANQWQ